MVNMKTQAKTQWWRDVRWDGCLVRPSNVRRLASESLAEAAKNREAVGWQEFAVPTINQHGPSCCGQAWANWFEMLIRREIGRDALKEGEQIDGYAIWRRARELFYGGNLGGGLFLAQGFAGAMELGILPPGTVLLDITPDLDCIITQLKETPLVQGHIVSDGWYEPNPENGCLDHSKLPKPGDGGHATCLMGADPEESDTFIVGQNTWGSDYAFHGYFVMDFKFWSSCYIGEGPFSARLPEGWTAWDGWRKYVTRNAQ